MAASKKDVAKQQVKEDREKWRCGFHGRFG